MKKALRERWTEDMIHAFESVVGRRKSDGFRKKHLPASPFGFVPASHFADYRGYPLYMLASVIGVSADFSYAKTVHPDIIHLAGVDFKDMNFHAAGQFHTIYGTFTDCNFSGINAVRGHLSGDFINCSFDEANLGRCSWAATFVNCSFENASLRDVTWPNCIFENCWLKDVHITFCPFKLDRAVIQTERVSFRFPKHLVKP